MDNQQRWQLQPTGTYEKIERKKGEKKISTHKILMNHMLETLEPIAISAN